MAEKPHYHGHRQRLRERFLAAEPDALPDYELLELLLFGANPRSDVKPLAKRLLAEFGDFAGVVSAPTERLKRVAGVGDGAAAILKAVDAGARRLAKGRIQGSTLGSWNALEDYRGHCKSVLISGLFVRRFLILGFRTCLPASNGADCYPLGDIGPRWRVLPRPAGARSSRWR